MYKTTLKQEISKGGNFLARRKRFFFALVVFIPLIVLIVWGFARKADQNGVYLGGQIETVEVRQVKYFVAQTFFKSSLSDISFEDLKGEQLASFVENVDEVQEILGVNLVERIEEEDLYAWVRNRAFEGFVIVPVERADFRLKTLAIDGIFIWDKGIGLSEYPLVTTRFVRMKKDEVTSFDKTNFLTEDVFIYVAGGEVIPARAVARKFRRSGDYTFPFHKVKSLFEEADVSSIVLENSIAGSPEPCYGCTWFIGDEAFIEGLNYLGVDVISPGNHIGDGGENAIRRTLEVLDEAGILHTGFSTLDLEDASNPAIVEVHGFKIAFLGYDDVAWFHWAGENWGGVSTISERFKNGTKRILREKIKRDVQRAKQSADYIVVLASWGDCEYVNHALDYQREMGHAFIDAGVDLIVGTHQHWVGEIEFYKGKPIFYGLGNFVFDQTHTDPTRQGVFLKLLFFQKKLVSVKIIPHQSCGPQQSVVDDERCNYFQPQILEESDVVYREIMERMFEFSDI